LDFHRANRALAWPVLEGRCALGRGEAVHLRAALQSRRLEALLVAVALGGTAALLCSASALGRLER
jgi:hypothetical protein